MTTRARASIGAGWIAGLHLEALARLGGTELVGVVSGHPSGPPRWPPAGAARPTRTRTRCSTTAKPDVVYLCVPPHRAVAIGERLVERGIPFLAEKPLAAADADGPARLAAAIERAGLVVAVGYHLRGLEVMSEVRRRFAARPAPDGRRALARRRRRGRPGGAGSTRAAARSSSRRPTSTTSPATSRRGEVVGAASTRRSRGLAAVDRRRGRDRRRSCGSTGGAIGSFANTRRLASSRIEIEFVSDDLLTTLRPEPERGQGGWQATFDDGRAVEHVPAGRDPYEVQAEAFLDAVAAARHVAGPLELRGRAPDRPTDAGRRRRDRRARLTAAARSADRRLDHDVAAELAVVLLDRRCSPASLPSAAESWSPSLDADRAAVAGSRKQSNTTTFAVPPATPRDSATAVPIGMTLRSAERLEELARLDLAAGRAEIARLQERERHGQTPGPGRRRANPRRPVARMPPRPPGGTPSASSRRQRSCP